jgi:hypothetical protein
MKNKFLKMAFSGLVLSFSGFANAGLIFEEGFDGFIGGSSHIQATSGNQLYYNGSHSGWASAGRGIHTVEMGSSDYSFMIWQDNILTQAVSIQANSLGQDYSVAFDGSAAVYYSLPQATRAEDGFLIEVLRFDGSILVSHDFKPGVWAGDMNFTSSNFTYVGDGSGDVRLRIGPSADTLNMAHFAGAINNLQVSTTDVPEPSIIALFAFGIVGVGFARRRQS